MKYVFLSVILLLMVAAGCKKKDESAQEPDPIHKELNSVYYWKTVLRIDSTELSFLDRHDIGRIYLRMFDVTEDVTTDDPGLRAIPNATLRIDDRQYDQLRDTLLSKEFVPVVYITLPALKAMKGKEETLADNITDRIINMCGYNSIPNVNELQLDCDWTASTEESYFTLCKEIKNSLNHKLKQWRVSSTIRLHQLSRKAPPVDCGVLMVYNTGNFNNPDTRNSILDAKDVKPYLKHLKDYPLHLDVAYPTYSWQLLYRDRKFAGLLNGLNLADTALFEPRGANLYAVRRDMPYSDRMLREGDMVRMETSDLKDIRKVKDMIERRLSGRPHSNILYHLDTDNLSNYTCDEIQHILHSDN